MALLFKCDACHRVMEYQFLHAQVEIEVQEDGMEYRWEVCAGCTGKIKTFIGELRLSSDGR